jgi:hypothetical protein
MVEQCQFVRQLVDRAPASQSGYIADELVLFELERKPIGRHGACFMDARLGLSSYIGYGGQSSQWEHSDIIGGLDRTGILVSGIEPS